MTSEIAIDIVLRWLHIFAAITLVGGTFYTRLVLLPVAEGLPEADRNRLFESLRGRWSKIVGGGSLFLIVSGIANLVRMIKQYDFVGYYHALLGVKVLLAICILFLASILSGKSPAAANFRKKMKFWLTINMVLAILLVAISGTLKVSKKTPKTEKPASTAVTE